MFGRNVLVLHRVGFGEAGIERIADDGADAEDIAQEVFIKAFQKLHTLRRWDNFLAWL